MALIRGTTVVGLILLFYIFSFVVFAILRIATGVSIQRVGYLSLRHIAFTPKEGFRIDIRSIGLSIHRPNFAQPTWVSLRINELKVTVDPAHLYPRQPDGKQRSEQGDASCSSDAAGGSVRKPGRSVARSKLWKRLTDVKERMKRVHRKINWLRLMDLIAVNTMVEVVGVGSVQLASFTVAVHTRRKFLDRGRLFRHKKDTPGDQRPAEWIVTMRSILLTTGTNEPVEMLDTISLNIHGILYKDREGLRDTSIAIKLGRLHVPIDELVQFESHTKKLSMQAREVQPGSPVEELSFKEVAEELDRPGSRESSIVQTVADSKEFLSSILHSVQEIQLAMTFVRVSKEVESLRQANLPLILNLVTHEVGFDLHRLDQTSPTHRMYFQRSDVAHQALLAAISISISLDDDESNSNKIVYVPMATTTIKTTLPAKTMSFTEDRDVSERNANILFANLVITSPSVDLTPRHLVQLLALSQQTQQNLSPAQENHHRIISRLLPKASIKFSIHEPVVRFVLPVAKSGLDNIIDYDMIISAISSISLEIESSHSAEANLSYSLASHFRIVSHTLYYQAANGVKHNLVVVDSLELKTQLTASTEVRVVASGVLRSFAVLMVREEVSKGVYDIVRHFKRNVQPEKLHGGPAASKPSFLRTLPSWLVELRLEGTDCSAEVAGIDKPISKETRGVALQLESWLVQYSCQSVSKQRRPLSRRKTSTTDRIDEAPTTAGEQTSPNSPGRKHPQSPTDGRRLTVHAKGLEGYIIESLDKWENQPFLSIPRFEIAFSTSRDLQGPIFHVNSMIRAVYLDYSLYRVYSIGVAGIIVKDAFLGPPSPKATKASPASHTTPIPSGDPIPSGSHNLPYAKELLTVDLKASYVQVKADLPADPSMLLQIYDIAAGRHRWSAPFLRSHLLRLHAEAPSLKRVWARIVSMNAIRIDLRPVKRKASSGFVDEQSIDLTTDFIRLAVPHGLTMYKVFDNIVSSAKAIAQLQHRFQTRTNEYILKKTPEGPKHIPKISIRSKALMFEMEDDPFEWKLSTIYHVGQAEQKQRIARAEAFRVKVKRMNEERQPRGTSRSRLRGHSSRPSSPATRGQHEERRSRSHDSHTPRRHSHSRGRRYHSSRRIRYDRDGVCALTRSAKLQAQDAWDRLQEHNARSWRKRIDATLALQNRTIKNIRRMFSGADEPPDADEHETILAIPNRPGLMSTVISDIHLVVDKPSFPMSELPHFINEIGKGMPLDTEYSLLVPMNLSLDMGEARVMLRDYPLNLLHVPAIRLGQPPRLPSWSLRTDFVIAEEYRDEQSIRHVMVDVVPSGKRGADGKEVPAFAIDVRRTVSPVKTYSRPSVEINTSLPTSISWGTSYQPVIQDMMMVAESFTKPEVDASDRVGFWDKIRMSFHSRLTVSWKGDGDLQFRLKGSRDPYIVTGYGAGFTMCWRNDVLWSIHTDDDPKRFMTVSSGEYLLAIPDYSHQARSSTDIKHHHDDDSMSSGSSHKDAAIFKKVIMKLSGNVQWTAGLVFERDLENGERSFGFKPHYEVILKNPKQMKQSDLTDYDAFRGFRSNHIHMSISVSAPSDRDWTATQPKTSDSYNAVHLTPRFFSHFWDWWSLFSGVMSLPIRQGQLWRGPDKPSKKFGRHLATIKYGLLLSPLFIAHIYKHKDAEDYANEMVSATGLKLRLTSFMLDLHQRREYFDTLSKVKGEQTKTSALKMNKAEVDFVSADLRAVAASIGGTTAEQLMQATDETLSSYVDPSPTVDMSQFTIPDQDFTWIDMDDFVELDWVLPAESNPETKILPLAYTPRFTYFRQTDHGDSIQGDVSRTSPFGDEPSHICVMGKHGNDPRDVQMGLIKARLVDIRDQLAEQSRLQGEQELLVIRDAEHDESVRKAYEDMLAQERELNTKRRFLEHGLRRLAGDTDPGEIHESHRHESNAASATDLGPEGSSPHVDMEGLFASPQEDFASDFNNRFIVHNMQLKWNNALRNTILRYSHQVSQRRGFVYYTSRRAVKFILDIVDEQAKATQPTRSWRAEHEVPATPSVISPSEEKDDELAIQDRIEQLLNDAKRFVNVDEMTRQEEEADQQNRPSTAELGEKIADHLLAMNSYHIRLIAPQIQLQSEKNTKAVVLVSAKGTQLKVVSIMDKARLSDDVSGLVQRRFALDMDGAQFFVTNQKLLAKYLPLYSGNRYGNAPGSSWPPWVSLEVMFDFHLNPFGFQRVIQKTSAALRYEKYNPLRLKYNEEVASPGGGDDDEVRHPQRKETRIDHLWVDFPRIRASCDSAQYYTMYIIVLDLLLYSEPLEKTRSERLEKIMLASDFSDLRGAPEMATSLQERIRQLEEIKMHFQINAKYLDRDGWQDRISLEKDLTSCEDELFFIMKAITTSQQKSEDRKSSESSGLLRWYLSATEIVWHLMRDKNEPLLEFQLGDAAYERIDNSDGSNHNAMEIESIRGFNLLPNAIYPDIIGPFDDPNHKHARYGEPQKMLQIHWYMLEAIAGIPVLEHFQVSVFPLQVQLERDLGKKLFEYIFPGAGAKEAEKDKNFSPFMVKHMEPIGDVEDAEAEEAEAALSPELSEHGISQQELQSSEPGAMGRRLKPTFTLDHSERHGPSPAANKHRGLSIAPEHPFRLFKPSNMSTDSRARVTRPQADDRKASTASLNILRRTVSGSTSSLTGLGQAEEKKKPAPEAKVWRSKKEKKEKPSDDLSQMLSRASSYMTLAHVRLDSFVICLSYKGKGDRNLEDLHGFVFRMPVLEYRNKTWSNLDLALRLKKDVIKALISHTGAIIGNKFTHHRPGKQAQNRLREIARGHTLIANSDTLVNTPSTSETGSVHSMTQNGDASGRASSQSTRLVSDNDASSGLSPSPLVRTASFSSSIMSADSSVNGSRNEPHGLGISRPPMSDPIGSFRSSTAAPPHRSLLKDTLTLGRQFTNEIGRHRRASLQGGEDGGDTSDPEGHRRKSVLLLGKKILKDVF